MIVDLNHERARLVVERLDPAGERASAVAADVRDREQLQYAFEVACRRRGRVDVLVNNAASAKARSFWELEQAEWDDVLAVNLRGVLFACQIVGAHMRELGSGRILNVSSLAGQQGSLVSGAHYSASKAGILVLTKIVASELAAHGVTVNAIAPAAIDSPLLRELGEQRAAELSQAIPIGRVGHPGEVAALAVFLCSDDAAYITGACYDINGGLFMR